MVRGILGNKRTLESGYKKQQQQRRRKREKIKEEEGGGKGF